jgi:hypothetical protein
LEAIDRFGKRLEAMQPLLEAIGSNPTGSDWNQPNRFRKRLEAMQSLSQVGASLPIEELEPEMLFWCSNHREPRFKPF